MAFENIYTPNNTEDLGTKYQRIDSNFDQIILDAPITDDQFIYIAISGNDTTGDGSELNPFQTVIGALQNIKFRKLAGITLTLFFNEPGTYLFGDAERDLLASILYAQCNIQIEGLETVLYTGTSFSEVTVNQMNYNASKEGLTVAENELRGKFISDSIRNYPISYNSAGSDNFTVEYMRGSRNGTYNIVECGVILDMSGASVDDFLNWNFIGLPSIIFKRVTIDFSGRDIELSKLAADMVFDFGTTINCNSILTGLFSKHTINTLNFTGVVINASSSSQAFDTRNAMGCYSFTRSLVLNISNSTTRVINISKNSSLELRESALIGNNGASFGLTITRLGSVAISKTVIFRNLNAVVDFRYIGGRLVSNNDQGYTYCILKNVLYIVNSVQNNSIMDIYGLITDGTFISSLNSGNITKAIDREKGIRMYVDGITLESNIQFTKQVIPLVNITSFSDIASFNLNLGNVQKMTLTGNLTNLSLTNKQAGGSYLIYLCQDNVGGRTIPIPDSSFGVRADNSTDFITNSNAINLIKINVDPNGITYYKIETYTL